MMELIALTTITIIVPEEPKMQMACEANMLQGNE